MTTYFLGRDYLAVSLIDAKQEFFRESFITFSELSQFEYFIQNEFNNRNINAVITSNSLDTLKLSTNISY